MGDLPLSPATTPSDSPYSAPPNTTSLFGDTVFTNFGPKASSFPGHHVAEPQPTAQIPNTGLLTLQRSVTSGDTLEMSPFVPPSSSADYPPHVINEPANAGSVQGGTLETQAAPPMDDLMAAFGFGSLVADQMPQHEGGPQHAAGSDSLYTSLGMR